ncbi:MAG TPA: RtcB family protein [Candidatus Nanoarchaeia archaeon]|nr:RtcB family protein [Candidatus Nanoarchaeia archaeon]
MINETGENIELKKISENIFEIPKQGNMHVPVTIFANEKLLSIMRKDPTLAQARNVACLPGIRKAFVMPDGHCGYGFPIGGVAAIDVDTGCICPGGIGYDLNCGVRLLRTSLSKDDVKEKLPTLMDALFKNVPAGLGEGNVKVSIDELNIVLKEGARWAVEHGYGEEDDLTFCEENGTMKTADAGVISDKAKKRGKNQLGSLGSGNHFLEVQYVDEVFNQEAASVFGLKKGQIVIMVHCGSRGLGHQTCSDFLREMEDTFKAEIEKLPDRELVYAPTSSEVCQRYFKAMSAAANFAWCNRHIIGDLVRRSVKQVFGDSVEVKTVYDVAHNIAKVEEYVFSDGKHKVYVHRKGATRAFGPGRKEIPEKYRKVGQPIIIPGSMGTGSYVLVGTEEALNLSCGSTAHGAGRMMSRFRAKKEYRGNQIQRELGERGIIVKGHSIQGIAEEAPGAYKDIDEVAKVSDQVGIANAVVRLRPIGVVKG